MTYESSPAQLAQALAVIDGRAVYAAMSREDALVGFILRAVERSAARRRHYARHHPRPLPIDGHEYRRRRRHR